MPRGLPPIPVIATPRPFIRIGETVGGTVGVPALAIGVPRLEMMVKSALYITLLGLLGMNRSV